MSRYIYVLKNPAKPYRENEEVIELGQINFYQWSSLFEKEFDGLIYAEFIRDKDAENYNEYHSSRIGQLKEKFPLIARIKDYYEDAIFYTDEIKQLIEEIKSTLSVVQRDDSRNFLNHLLSVVVTAQENNAGIHLIAD